MASYSIEFAKGVRKDFKSIPTNDADRILKKIESLSRDPRPMDSRKLTSEDAYRVRIGNYRVVYDIYDQVLLILVLKIGHRKNVYKR